MSSNPESAPAQGGGGGGIEYDDKGIRVVAGPGGKATISWKKLAFLKKQVEKDGPGGVSVKAGGGGDADLVIDDEDLEVESGKEKDDKKVI